MSDPALQPAQRVRLPALAIPGQRPLEREGVLDRFGHTVAGLGRACAGNFGARYTGRMLKAAAQAETALATADDAILRVNAIGAGRRLQRAGFSSPLDLGKCLGALRIIALRTIELRPHDVQLIGAEILVRGKLAEMATGEGKTLVAGLAAGVLVLSGVPVHVVTVNDYLAERDAQTLTAFYDFLQISVGVIVSDVPHEHRANIYQSDVCYCTNKELAFDYLRGLEDQPDNQTELHRKVSGFKRAAGTPASAGPSALRFAIIDEADSVLIDEARTPLIISEGVEDYLDEFCIQSVFEATKSMQLDKHFNINRLRWSTALTELGRQLLHEVLSDVTDGPLTVGLLREELATQALMAQHLYNRDEHYVVRDETICIVDEYTGRVMPDRHWGAGLHQMVEAKEGCELTKPRRTKARMTYQRFFRRYKQLAGMTGTAHEVRRELWNVYGLQVVRVPTHQPSRRSELPDKVYRSEAEKWPAVVARVQELHRLGIPVVIGARTISGTEKASAALTEAGLGHEVLNAVQDDREAEIIAQAGQPGQITVATNMAGRGTDIRLGEGVRDLGGLHVIMTERHDAFRIDRQLQGRCGRQGDPGCFVAMLSLDDSLANLVRPFWLLRIARWAGNALDGRVGRVVLRFAQRRLERQHSKVRERLLRADQSQSDLLAFSGTPE